MKEALKYHRQRRQNVHPFQSLICLELHSLHPLIYGTLNNFSSYNLHIVFEQGAPHTGSSYFSLLPPLESYPID
eukprot:Pgem_evm1s3383